MKRIPIFKPGRHTPTSGASLEFSEDMLRAAVKAYDPGLHIAPIVVGHPKTDDPAYGWVERLEFNERTGEIDAIPSQVEAQFGEMVQSGRFKTRSASWYLPGSPSHPLKGKAGHDSLYLKHVGFLGAQPPAVKGLKSVEFAEAEEGVVEFSDYSSRWGFSSMAAIARAFREWLIADKGTEAADKVVPNYLITDLESAAKAPDPEPAQASPAFAEEDPMTIAELQAQVAALTAKISTLQANQKPADFAERETSLAAREAAVAAAEAAAARVTIESRVDAAIADGRLLKAQRQNAINFASSLADGETVIEFSEGDKTEKVSQREAYLRGLEKAAKIVDFGERSGDNGAGQGEGDPVAEAAVKLAAQVATGKA